MAAFGTARSCRPLGVYKIPPARRFWRTGDHAEDARGNSQKIRFGARRYRAANLARPSSAFWGAGLGG
jgi:hypothetical protein